MAYIRDYAVTEVTTASTNPSADVEFPIHETNDILLMILACDGTNTAALPADWTNIQDDVGTAQTFRLCYKKALSSSEVCPTLSLAAGDEWHIIVIAVAGADYDDPINFSAEDPADDNAAPFNWAAATPSTDETNVLIFQYRVSDTGLALTATTIGYTNLVNGDAGTAGCGCAYTFQPASGSITNCNWTGRANDTTTACVVGINDDGNGTRPAYADPTTSGIYISALGGTSLIENDTNPTSLPFGSVGMQDFDQFWAFDGTATYTDDTTDINSAATNDVTITNAVGAIWYFGYDYPYNHMVLNRQTASSGGTIVWEYYNGSTWATLTVTGALTATGWVRLTWVRPSTMSSVNINGVTKYYVRMRVSATFTTAPILSQGHVGGWLTTFDTVANVADAGVNPYMDAISLTPAATSNFSGMQRQFGSAKDMDTGILVFHHKSALGRDYAVDVARNDVVYPVTEIGLSNKNGTISGYGGFVVQIADADSEYEAYAIHSKLSKTADYHGYNVTAIALNNGATAYGTRGTLNKSAVTRIAFLPQGSYGAMAAYVSSLLLVSEIVFAGGDSTNPIDVNDLRFVANNCIGSSLLFLGTGDFNRIYAPLQFGGNHQIKTNVDGAIFQFPTAYDGIEYLDWNAGDNVAGVEFYGTGSNDWLKFPNCVWKGSQPFRWEFNSSHNASTILDFTGNTVNGGTVTLRSTVTLSDLTFRSCDITLNSAAISGSTITNKRSSATGGLVFTSTTEGNNITSCSFITNHDGDIGHSIRITAAGTYTFDGHIFTGGGPAERTFLTSSVNETNDTITTDAVHGYSDGDAIYYQDQGGSVTMGLTDGNLYYVTAPSTTTLSFYSTKAQALAGTPKVALTQTGSETHHIYSAKADVFADVSGSTTINVTNGGDVPTIRERDGALVSVILSVNVSLTVLDESNDPVQYVQVYFQKSATGKNWNYTSDSGNSAGDADFVVNEAVDLDIPQTGWLHVWDASSNTKQNYRYASWSGTTFTLPTEVTGSATSGGTSTTLNSTGIGALNIQEGDTIRNTTDGSWAVVDELTTNSATTSELQGGSDNTWQNSDSFSVHKLALSYTDGEDLIDIPIFNGQTDVNGQVSTTYNYSAYNTNLPVVIRVRSNQGATKYIPYNTSGTVTSSGYSGTVVLTRDTVAT